MSSAGTGCDMTEEELLAMLRGIDSGKIKKQGRDLAGAEDPAEGAGPAQGQNCETVDSFLEMNEEDGDFNQYWYSKPSINKMVEETRAEAGRPMKVAFLSTPSIFFSLSEEEREQCVVLDFDRKWEAIPGFQFYDFNDPEGLPAEMHHAFEMLVIDPPFITREVWEKYTTTAKLLLQPGGKLLCSTVDENAEMMKELLDVHTNVFRPRIPNLVYQYSFYTNYASEGLSQVNQEIGF
uniref:Protein-lysine N-methyltransferase n=1 Tax=Rhizochromulina marina TaxID=1034831 RepID=A0A7S2RLB1_9STRA